jgi:hypothetical protein
VRGQCHRLEGFTIIRGSAPARGALPGDALNVLHLNHMSSEMNGGRAGYVESERVLSILS